jgi:hypothetical protein
MKKKLLSCALIVAMVATMGTITAVATSAEEVNEDARGTIYFDSTNLYKAKKDNVMYCYVWSDTEGSLFKWDSKACKMTNIGDYLYSYDVPVKSEEGEAINSNLMIFHALGGNQTWEVTFDDSCMGDTAYVSGDYYGMFPVDTEMAFPMVSWKNNKSNGAHISITSLGKVYGTHLSSSETPESIVDVFINNYKEGMDKGYTGYENPELVTDENRAKLIEEITKIVAENTELPTEAPTDEATQPSTEAPTDEATQPSTEAPTDEATQPGTEASTDEATQPSTTAPTEKPTSSATTATQNSTTAPTTATATTSTNTTNGTVNTSQTSAVTALALTFMSSMGIAFFANKKREKKN